MTRSSKRHKVAPAKPTRAAKKTQTPLELKQTSSRCMQNQFVQMAQDLHNTLKD